MFKAAVIACCAAGAAALAPERTASRRFLLTTAPVIAAAAAVVPNAVAADMTDGAYEKYLQAKAAKEKKRDQGRVSYASEKKTYSKADFDKEAAAAIEKKAAEFDVTKTDSKLAPKRGASALKEIEDKGRVYKGGPDDIKSALKAPIVTTTKGDGADKVVASRLTEAERKALKKQKVLSGEYAKSLK